MPGYFLHNCLLEKCQSPQYQALQTAILQGKKLNKSIYVFSADVELGNVSHANYVSESMRTKGLDARNWALKAVDILGGKVEIPLLLFLVYPC
jgi:hypothetical protein